MATELFSCWKASCTTGCIPTLQGNDEDFYFQSYTYERDLGNFFSRVALEEIDVKSLGGVSSVCGGFPSMQQDRKDHFTENLLDMKCRLLMRGPSPSSPCFFLQRKAEIQATADRSHMLPRCSALQRCQASLKE